MAARGTKDARPGAAPEVMSAGQPRGTARQTGTGSGKRTGAAGARPTARGPAAGIGAPIYEELVRELGDPAA